MGENNERKGTVAPTDETGGAMDVPAAGTQDGTHLAGLGAFIRERRMALGLTQTELAARLGWVQERISLLERGKYGMPSIQGLARLAPALDSTLVNILHAAGFMDETIVSLLDSRMKQQSGMALFYALQRLFTIDATSLQSAVGQAADIVVEVMSSDKVDVYFYDPRTDALVALGSSNTPMGRRQIEIGLDKLPVKNGGREVEVFQTGKSYRSGRAEDDPEMLRGFTEGLGVESLIAVPLDVAGTRRGVLVTQSAQLNRFTEDEVVFLQTVAHWVGMIAHRADLTGHFAEDSAHTASQAEAEEVMTVLAQDLGNHLTPLRGNLDSLQRNAQLEARNDDLQTIQESRRALERVDRLVTELHDAARLEHSLYSLSVRPVDLIAVIRDVADEHRSAGQTIAVTGPNQLLIRGDPSKLCQAMDHLVSNAILHSPADGRIRVEAGVQAREDGDWAVIHVGDNGPAIPDERLPSLFTRFSKGSQSPGFGLRLFMAREIARAHGGTLTVESTAGKGASFWLSLPLSPAT